MPPAHARRAVDRAAAQGRRPAITGSNCRAAPPQAESVEAARSRVQGLWPVSAQGLQIGGKKVG